MKIVFLDAATMGLSDLDSKAFDRLGQIELFDRTGPQQVLERIKEAPIVISNKVVLDEDILRKSKELKLICIAATGMNNVNLEVAKELGIEVKNVAGYSTAGVAQHVFAMLLTELNRVKDYHSDVKRGRWQASPDFAFYDHPIRELNGKTMGLFGFGTIGQAVAKIAKAFGMRVIATHKHPIRDKKRGVTFVPIEKLFEQSDVISLHAPLNESTDQIVDSKLLDKTKENAILVNTARGGLIDEKDLANHLREHKRFTACLDVLNEEPPQYGSPLIGIPNCIITPHQAWASVESRQRLLNGIVKNIRTFSKK